MLLCALCGEFLLKEKSEVESEAYFQSELRQITVFETQIIIDSRFDGNSPCQEKRIASFRIEGKVGRVSYFPVIAIHLQSGSEINAAFVEIISSTHTQCVLIFRLDRKSVV